MSAPARRGAIRRSDRGEGLAFAEAGTLSSIPESGYGVVESVTALDHPTRGPKQTLVPSTLRLLGHPGGKLCCIGQPS